MRNELKKIFCVLLAILMISTLSFGLMGCSNTDGTATTEATATGTVDATGETGEGTGATGDATEPTGDETAPTGDATEATGETEATVDPTETTAANNGHVHNYVKEIIPPRCETSGYDLYECECGSTYTSGYYKPVGHGFVKDVIPPTATEQGYTLHLCAYCDYSYKDNYVPATGNASDVGNGSAPNTNTGMPSEEEIANAVIKYVNQLRAEQGSATATAIPGLTQIAKDRANQIVYDFRHDNIALKALCAKYQYGEYVDMTVHGLDASENYYTFGGAEAIGKGTSSKDADYLGRKIAEGFKNSAGHWRYVGDGANAYIGVGIAYNEYYEWYCCINLSKVNYG